ncbi:MAG TPA: hypothetical protein P5564_05165 [Paludibacteraceae bacterium]|jgi:hypothetical protein|nr:hypothetical protein [Paludibacteraceae bacterium]
MKKILFLTAFAMVLVGCGHQKSASKTHKTSTVVETLPEHINFSTSFRAFWDEFYKDTKGAKTLEKYVPSEAFQTNPAISNVNDVFVLSGYLTVTPEFDQTAFEALGGTLTQLDASTMTFTMPLTKLPEMIQLQGIESVEAAIKVFRRK